MSEPRWVAPDCQACGACCHGRGHPFVLVWRDDLARMTEADRALVEPRLGGGGYMRSVPVELAGRTYRRCVALGQEGGRWSCTIYERRPQACRDYARDSLSCEVDVDDHGAATAALLI